MRPPSLLPTITTLILLPTVLAKHPPPSHSTSTAISTTATTPALQAIFTTNPTLPMRDLGRRWTEMIGSKEYLRELVAYDERVACETKEKEESKNGTTVGGGNVTGDKVEAEIASRPEEKKKDGTMMMIIMMMISHTLSKPRS